MFSVIIPLDWYPADPLYNVKTVYGCNRNHDRAAMLLIPHFRKKPAMTALPYRMSAIDVTVCHKQETQETYCQFVNYLLKDYEPGDDMAKVKSDIMKVKRSRNMSAVPYL